MPKIVYDPPFDISHLHEGEQNRIRYNGPNHEEEFRISRGENPWPNPYPKGKVAHTRAEILYQRPPGFVPHSESSETNAELPKPERKTESEPLPSSRAEKGSSSARPSMDEFWERVEDAQKLGQAAPTDPKPTEVQKRLNEALKRFTEESEKRSKRLQGVLGDLGNTEYQAISFAGNDSEFLAKLAAVEDAQREVQREADREAAKRDVQEAIDKALRSAEARERNQREVESKGRRHGEQSQRSRRPDSHKPDVRSSSEKSRVDIWTHLKGSLHWCAVNLWRWEVIAIGTPLLYGVGVAAMYADQYPLAAALYFIAIGISVAKVITHIKTHEYRVGIAVIAIVLGGALFGASYWLIEYRHAQVASKTQDEHPTPMPALMASPQPTQIFVASPSPLASQTARRSSSKGPTSRRSKAEEERRRKSNALRILHSP